MAIGTDCEERNFSFFMIGTIENNKQNANEDAGEGGGRQRDRENTNTMKKEQIQSLTAIIYTFIYERIGSRNRFPLTFL